jgi:ABC-2 type transport system ATP-binding protein
VGLTIAPGEIVGILGPNGAGKTTLVKMLAGLVEPTSGEARVLGFVPSRRETALRRRYALVLGQKNQLWWDLPARDSYELNRVVYEIAPDRYRERLEALSGQLAAGGLLDKPLRELSLGERMKCELIGALLHGPEVLFLDEPTIGLDILSQRAIRDCVRRAADRGAAVLLTTHILRDVEALADRVLVIDHGRVGYQGPLSGIARAFSDEKRVKLKFSSPVENPPQSRDARVLEAGRDALTLAVKREAVSAVCAELLASLPVEDILVEDPPIEDAVAQLFSRNRDRQ